MKETIIRKLSSDDICNAMEVFESAYKDMNVPDGEQEWFAEDLNRSFDPECSKMMFFKIERDSKLISFAALEALTFTEGVWALRWGTTHPSHQRQGLMTELTKYRIKYAEENTNTIGSIHLMARSPGIYLKLGFQQVYERGPENKATYMMKVINTG